MRVHCSSKQSSVSLFNKTYQIFSGIVIYDTYLSEGFKNQNNNSLLPEPEKGHSTKSQLKFFF